MRRSITCAILGAAATGATITATYGATLPATLTVTANQPANIASQASVSVSSENASTGQLGIKAVDGIIDGYLNDDDTVTFTLRDPATTQGL